MWTILFAILPAIGVAEFSLPALTGPVVDEARLLSPDTRARLDRFLQDLRVRGGSQIQVVTLRSLSGHSIEEAGIKLAEAWKLGGAKQDDGVIVVLAPTERRVRIEVGQGREGELPDVVASRIIREVIVPRMREGDADGAVRDGVLAIVHYTDPDFAREAGDDGQSTRPPRPSFLIFFLFLGVFALLVVLPRASRGRRSVWTGSGWGGGWGGGGWGGGGGGWSGGGGGFSGGGASGGW